VTRHEFIGYQSETETGLDYAYARFYDPELGQFLSHDPAAQFPSPYAYGPDPINGADPTGEIFGIDDAIVLGVIYAAGKLATVAAAVYATQVTINYARSGDWGFALDPGNAVTDPVPSQGGVPGLVGGPSLPNACSQGGIQVCNTWSASQAGAGAEPVYELGAEELAALRAAIDAAHGQGQDKDPSREKPMVLLDGPGGMVFSSPDEAQAFGEGIVLSVGAGLVGGMISWGGRATATVARGINPRIYAQLEKQLAEHGAQTIRRGLQTARKTLAEHVSKLERLRREGGYTSAVEKTIQNVQRQIKTMEKFIRDKDL
jgi:RHS repeat-associated protein